MIQTFSDKISTTFCRAESFFFFLAGTYFSWYLFCFGFYLYHFNSQNVHIFWNSDLLAEVLNDWNVLVSTRLTLQVKMAIHVVYDVCIFKTFMLKTLSISTQNTKRFPSIVSKAICLLYLLDKWSWKNVELDAMTLQIDLYLNSKISKCLILQGVYWWSRNINFGVPLYSVFQFSFEYFFNKW